MVERFVYTEDVGSSTLSTPTISPLSQFCYSGAVMRFFLYFFLSVLIFVPAVAAQTAPQNEAPTKPKTYQPRVEIWLPPAFQSSEEKWPLIVFSHRFGGCETESAFLAQYMADNGYIVVAPRHQDADCQRMSGMRQNGLQTMRSGKSIRPEESFRTPRAWTDKIEKDRREDVLFAVSSLLDDRQYKNYVDTDHMGLMGQELGGYTVLGTAGGWKAWRDARFKAVAAYAPYTEPYLMNRGLPRIRIPVLLQEGSRTRGYVPDSPYKKTAAYGYAQAPKYYIELDGAAEQDWSMHGNEMYRAIIQGTTLAFFDKYLKEKDVVLDYKPGKNNIKTFWKDEGSGANDQKR